MIGICCLGVYGGRIGCDVLILSCNANFHTIIYHKIYRDDGLVVFKVKNSAREIKDSLEEFHKTVNKAAVN